MKMEYYLVVTLAVLRLVRGNWIESHSYEGLAPEGHPLILTPYIQNGSTAEGREASRVTPFLDGINSYSGFFTVNASSNGNIFFWYFPAGNTPEKAPVMIWLQGGPGGSSMGGLYLEHGPLQLKNDHQLEKRPTRWTKNIHMIYVDNPVGTGFSFSDQAGYSKNEDQISTNLHEFLVQFFQLYPEISPNEFFVAGESYAGKYVPALADKIHKRNHGMAKVEINLKGLAIGDGVVDPMPGPLYHTGNTLAKNERQEEFPYHDLDVMKNYLNRVDVQKQIHVNGMKYNWENNDVYDILIKYDWFTPVTLWVEELLNHYRVLYYNGKLDTIIDYRATEKFAATLEWNGSQAYRTAKMTEWRIRGENAGNFQTGGNLTLLLVNKAGHMVPMYQPKWTSEMISKFVKNEPLS